MNDYERELANSRGYIQETVFDGGRQSPTSVYKTWEDYDSGNPMGSYGGGYQSQFGKWADAVGKSNIFKQSKAQQDQSGYPSFAQFQPGTGGSYESLGGGKGVLKYETPGFTVWNPATGGMSQGGGGGGQSGIGKVAGAGLGSIATYGALAANPVTAPFAVGGAILSGVGSLFG